MDNELPNDLVGMTEAGIAVGLNKSTVSRYALDGLLTRYGSKARPKVSLSELRSLIANGLDPAKRRGPAVGEAPDGTALPPPGSQSGAAVSLVEERIGKTRAERLSVERENAKEEGLLVEAAAVANAVLEIGLMQRAVDAERVHGLAQKLAGLTDVREIAALLGADDHARYDRYVQRIGEILAEAGINVEPA